MLFSTAGSQSEPKACHKYSGIGGQAVMEGIMMRNEDRYSVAVRKSDGQIEVMTDSYRPVFGKSFLTKLPFIRGVFVMINSLVLGLKTLNWSAEFVLEEEDEAQGSKKGKDDNGSEKAAVKDDAKAPGADKAASVDEAGADKAAAVDEASADAAGTEAAKADKADKSGAEMASDAAGKDKDSGKKEGENSLLMALTIIFSLVISIVIFMLIPYFVTEFIRRFTDSEIILAVVEGVLRLMIFVGYVAAISLMDDIKRVYMYHGAEHKCINCIENGMELKVENVMRSSRLHPRCGTSFMLFVMVISIVLFFFIRSENPMMRLGIRLALIPVIAGISYEVIRLAGKTNNILVRILSAPGLTLQRITTREPDEQMAQVAIEAVEAVFDWREYLKENFSEIRV